MHETTSIRVTTKRLAECRDVYVAMNYLLQADCLEEGMDVAARRLRVATQSDRELADNAIGLHMEHMIREARKFKRPTNPAARRLFDRGLAMLNKAISDHGIFVLKTEEDSHRLAAEPLSLAASRRLRGSGWEGDLDEMRGAGETWS